MLPRLYDRVLATHFQENRQMAFLAGPRQVGKTEAARRLADVYLEPVRKELVFEAGHFTCSPFFRTSPNNYGFCLLCLLSTQKNHIFERELAQLDFFLRFLDVFSAESGRLG